MEGMLSELDYLEPECYQLSILEEYDRDYSPIQSITPGSPIEFFIKGADGLYVDLNNSKLEVRAKITLENGNKIPDNANVGPLNDLLNALFMTAEMELGGVLLTDTNTKYPYRAYIENLINFNKLIQETRMICEGWTKDTARHLNVFDITSTNTGLASRAAWFASSNVRTLIGRPHFDLFHQDRLIPPNIDMKFRFLPSKNSFLVKAIAPTGTNPQINYKVDIISARFFIKTKAVAPSLALAQEKILQTKNFKIPYKRVTAKTLTIPSGTTTFESDNVYLGKIPDMLLLGLVSDANMSGGYQNNPFYFQHFGLNYLCLKANGEQFPRLAYQPDFANNDYIRAYFTVLEALGYDIGIQNWNLSPEEWANGFTIFAFKLSPGPIGNGVLSPPHTGSVKVEIKFATGTTENINLLFLAQTPAEIQIDQHKNVILLP